VAEPARKSPGIAHAIDRHFGEPGRIASIQSNRCVKCKGPAVTFKDGLSAREYRISGLCQSCQDDFFEASEQPAEYDPTCVLCEAGEPHEH
jgi:hypothetical protein